MRWLRNPTQEDIEFQFGGLSFAVKAGQTAGFDDNVVKHYVGYVNGPLVEVLDILVRIVNTTNKDQTFRGVTIKANSELELPKRQAKSFIRSVDGIDWVREGVKKDILSRVGGSVRRTWRSR